MGTKLSKEQQAERQEQEQQQQRSASLALPRLREPGEEWTPLSFPSAITQDSWRNNDQVIPARKAMVVDIAQVLLSAWSESTKTTLADQNYVLLVLPFMAKHMELSLFESAASFTEYGDKGALKNRLKVPSQRLRDEKNRHAFSPIFSNMHEALIETYPIAINQDHHHQPQVGDPMARPVPGRSTRGDPLVSESVEQQRQMEWNNYQSEAALYMLIRQQNPETQISPPTPPSSTPI